MPRLRASYAEFQKCNPSRVPRWRYERVRQLVDHRPEPLPPIHGRDDKWVRGARKFLLEYARVNRVLPLAADPDYHRRNLYGENPGLYFAYEIGTSGRQERTRCELEARILARQTDEEIGEIIGMPPGAVMWYEALFFHVRDRLNHRGYITSQVLYPNMLTGGIEQLSLGTSAKFFGYFAGPAVLGAILDCYDSNTPLPKTGETADEFFRAYFSSTVHRRSAQSSQVFEINRYNVMRLFELNGKLVELSLTSQKNRERLNDIEDLVEGFFGGVPWAASEKRAARLKGMPIGGYLGQAAEPRAEEAFQIQRGEPTPDLDALRDKEFPHIQD